MATVCVARDRGHVARWSELSACSGGRHRPSGGPLPSGRPRRARCASGRDRRHASGDRVRAALRRAARFGARPGGRGGRVGSGARHRRRSAQRSTRRRRLHHGRGRRGGRRSRRTLSCEEQAARSIDRREGSDLLGGPAGCACGPVAVPGTQPGACSSGGCGGRGRVARRRRFDAHRQRGHDKRSPRSRGARTDRQPRVRGHEPADQRRGDPLSAGRGRLRRHRPGSTGRRGEAREAVRSANRASW